ncbi:MAG: DUF2169 domain-containing protein [Minicystis sp.]
MDFDARLENLTPMEVRGLPMDDRHGRAVIVAIAKATYAVSKTGVARLAWPPAPIRIEDELHEDSPYASIKYPCDWVDEKPGTDVIVVGTAIPPVSAPVTEMDVSVRVGRLFKAVRVHGPRVYQAAVFGGVAPGPSSRLGPTPIRYELAYGGVDDLGDRVAYEGRNPSGVGFAEQRRKRAGAPAPRLTVPTSLADPGRDPAGFGAIAAHWSPRLELAGTRDEAWRRTRAPVAPVDFDPRHNNAAHPDLHSSTPLRPDEPIELVGLTPEQVFRFRVPDVEPLFFSRRDGEVRAHDTHLDTMLIDADARRVELSWRVSLPLPRKAQRLDRIMVRATGELPPSVRELPFSESQSPEAA